ncbi:hypothetical protein M0R45_019599 [Rubus argutus]|uniref:MHC class I antigen n=1 Tax=Rubus argutus TaxID=59490 RepID=A0AAW1X760_RUBAR
MKIDTVVRCGWTTQPCAREDGTALLVQVEGSAMSKGTAASRRWRLDGIDGKRARERCFAWWSRHRCRQNWYGRALGSEQSSGVGGNLGSSDGDGEREIGVVRW